ncbi:hypothetical protein DPMN_055458 [Dreissena polymorpha]|uniref:Tuftelin interacting protein N-terminal domain-containing protein n=1 Tax=Dreissena polymorpha TaxID=45954 RepID=A0A9D4CSR0_DREPO|nr:hypothetical protein DPMN_055458 [Dreissena polymorpha]
MSSPEVEKFEITDDDVYNSFNIRHNEEDDNERPGFGGRGKKKSDFTAPIGFVSGGIKQGDKTFKPGEEKMMRTLIWVTLPASAINGPRRRKQDQDPTSYREKRILVAGKSIPRGLE